MVYIVVLYDSRMKGPLCDPDNTAGMDVLKLADGLVLMQLFLKM